MSLDYSNEINYNESSLSKVNSTKLKKACDRCLQKKIKCINSSLNSCDNCISCKDGTICSLEADRSIPKGKQLNPTKGYVESLEKRLEALESLLKALSDKSEVQDSISSRGLRNFRSDSMGTDSSSPLNNSRSPRDELSDSLGTNSSSPHNIEEVSEQDEKLIKDLEDLTVADERYFGRGSGIHLARSLGQFSPPGRSTIGFKPETTLSIVEDWIKTEEVKRNSSQIHPLPPVDLAQKLVKAYFKNINSIQPLLHYPSFKRAWDFNFIETIPSFRGLFFAVCALGSRFVNDSRLNLTQGGVAYSKGYEYFSASTTNATVSSGAATLFDIQASCLSAIWLLGSSSPITTWAAIGSSLRRVIDVGAHRENRSRWNASPLEDQLRKRAVFILIGLDRQTSATLGRPLALQEEDYDILEPLDISDTTLDEWNIKGTQSSPPPPSLTPTPLSGIKCIIQLHKIMGRTMRLLYGTNRGLNSQKTTEAVCELDSQLNEWLQQVPIHLRWDPNEQNSVFLPQSVAIYSTYYSCQILIHRDFLSPARVKLHPFPSLAICGNAARSLSHLLDALRQKGRIETAFWYAPFAAVTAGLVLLINVFATGNTGPNLTTSATADVQRCFAVLKVLAENTFIAQKVYGGFKVLAGVATANNSLDPALSSRKRSNEDDSSPQSDTSSSSNFDQPPIEKQPRQSLNGERDFRPLPLTTQDLSLLTFNGYPTFFPTTSTSNVNENSPPPFVPPQQNNLNVDFNLPSALNPTGTESAPFNFNWPLYNNAVPPSTLSTADENLLQNFYQTGTLPIPSTPSASMDHNSFLSNSNNHIGTPSLSSNNTTTTTVTNGGDSESPTTILNDEFGFNFDPNVPFDWDATFGGNFDLESLTQSFPMPVDNFS